MTASLPRFARNTAIVLAGACALGIVPVLRFAPADATTQHVLSWGLAFGFVFFGALVGFLPMTSRFAAQSLETRAQAFLIGLGLRLFLVLTACLIVWTTRVVPPLPFLLGAGVGYALVLAVEIAELVRSAGREAVGPSPASASPEAASGAPATSVRGV